ncbi:MAG: glycosyltransferase family 2 protein [Reyranella sp.]|nr:glycosyltransferase family 2 protein [Reyranella sp.]MDP3161098.1 glycosyltransferase family 2 protein [Reyranella sp.]
MKIIKTLDRGIAQDEPIEIEYRFERALTIIVPALNEAAAIRDVVEGLVRVAKDCLDRFEIVAIDDGSADDTGAILDELKKKIPELAVVHHTQRQGVGVGFRAGLALATAPFVTVVPGDGAYPPESLRAAFKMVGSARHIGSTRMNQASARGSFRSLYSRIYKFGIGWLLQLPVSDLHSVHIYAVDSLRRLRLTQNGYLYGIEALAAADIDPHDLSETEVTLAPDRDRVNRSLHLSTLLDLLSTLGSLSHRLFAGLKAHGLLVLLAAYSLVWVLLCLQFNETPHLQDLVPKGARSSWSYLAATLATLPAIVLLPLTFGLLLLSLFDRKNNIPHPSDDHVLLSIIAGAAALIPLGTLLGAAGLLQQAIIAPVCLAVVWLGLLRHPGALRSFFDYVVLRGTATRPSVVLTRLTVLCALLLVLIGQALPVDVLSTDVMQIYYAFLARVKVAGNFWIDSSAPDLSDFLIGRGNGLHMILAAMFHPYIGGLISIAYICGILLIVRRVGALLLDGTLGKQADLRQSAWVAALDLLVLATLISTLLRVEFAKYHLQLGFLVAAGLYLLVLQFHREAKAGMKTSLVAAISLAVALPFIFPQHLVFAGILLGAATAVGFLYRNWRFVSATVGVGVIAGLACFLSLMINYTFVGIPELYPTSIFARFADAERYGQLSSFEVWRYIYLAQNLNDQAIEIGPSAAERFFKFLNGALVNAILLGSAELRGWILAWNDAHWKWLAGDPRFAVTCLLPLILVTLVVLYKPRARILPVTIAVLLLTAPASYIAGQWPSVFVIAAPVSLYAVLSASAAALIAAAIAKSAATANERSGNDVSMSLVGKVSLALMFVLLGMGLLYALVPGESINRMFLAFSPLTSVLVILFACVWAGLFLNARSSAIALAQLAGRPDRFKVVNITQVVACLIICTAMPAILIGVPAAQLGAGTPFAALAIAVHILIVALASISLYRLLRPGLFKGLSLSRWASLDARFVGRTVATAFALFALTSIWNERGSLLHMIKQVRNPADGPMYGDYTWNFDRCIEMAEIVKGRGRILPVNATEQAIPCYAPIGLPRGTFVHHYNSLLAPNYALALYGSPDELEKFYRSNNVNFFYFDRQERDYIWGHGFSSLFGSESLLRRFDVAHEAKDYFLLTWRGQGQRPVDAEITDELARLRPLKIKNWPLAQKAYERLRQELLESPRAKAN